MKDRIEMIKQRLQEMLSPSELDIEDETALHAGHAGTREGKGHYAVRIISKQFAGKNLIQRHRMVYQALADAMQNEIHALSIRAITPDELKLHCI